MNRKQMVNAIYDKERIRSELISRELWQQLAEMTDAEIEQKYKKVCDNET
jgi:hypothetical protein